MSSNWKTRRARSYRDRDQLARSRRTFAAGRVGRTRTTIRKDTTMTDTTAGQLPYTLMDCIKQNADYPDTFEIPDPHEIEAIRPGDFVKLIFAPTEPDPEAVCGAERMWVKVTTAGTGGYTGTLDNMPVLVPLEPGEVIEFTSANIASIMPAQGDAMVVEFSEN